MSKIIPFADPRKAREAATERAGEFLARLDAGATPEDLARLRTWLAAAPLHREVFLELAALWDNMSVLATLAEVFPLQEYAGESAQTRKLATWSLAAAACLVLAIGALWLARTPLAGAPSDAEVPVFPEPAGFVQQFHETAIGEQANVTLPDGSEVLLNTNTVIEIVYSDKGRNIFLTRGEGLFTVSKDPARPFRVYAGNRLIEAVGTTFNVQHTQPDEVQVVVKEGKVNFLRMQASLAPQTLPDNLDAVLYRDENVPLSAGEYAASGNGRAAGIEKVLIQPSQLEVRLAWTRGMLLFQGEPLEQALREVSRYTTMKLEADASILNTPVEGYFRAGDVNSVLVTIREKSGIESEVLAEDHIVLRARNQTETEQLQ